VTEHGDAIFDDPFLHGLPRSLTSLLSSDDPQHVSTQHASSSLVGSLVDDS
jgi:hypothetical protein